MTLFSYAQSLNLLNKRELIEFLFDLKKLHGFTSFNFFTTWQLPFNSKFMKQKFNFCKKKKGIIKRGSPIPILQYKYNQSYCYFLVSPVLL
jgi:hypothetical protein